MTTTKLRPFERFLRRRGYYTKTAAMTRLVADGFTIAKGLLLGGGATVGWIAAQDGLRNPSRVNSSLVKYVGVNGKNLTLVKSGQPRVYGSERDAKGACTRFNKQNAWPDGSYEALAPTRVRWFVPRS